MVRFIEFTVWIKKTERFLFEMCQVLFCLLFYVSHLGLCLVLNL